MVLPRQKKSAKTRQKLTNSSKKRQTTITNSKQKSVQTKRKKLTKRVDLNNPSTNPITLRRSRRLNNQQNQSSNISCESTSNSLPTNHITKIYPLRSRLRRESLTSTNPTTTTNRRSRTSKQEDLSSMGLRNGKIVNLRSVISGSTSQTTQELTSSTLPLLAFNPLPRHHHQTTNSTSSSSSYSSIISNNNNNNNNNEFNSSICQYHYSNITNHPSLDSTQYFPVRLDILLDRPPVSREKQIEYGWNHDDRSMNIFVKHNDPCTFHRHPVAQSTDAVRCKKGFTNGIHVWEIEWNTRQRGTHAVVGVGTIKAPLHCPGYQALVGMNQESWGWDLGRNKLYHKGVNSVYASTQYPSVIASSSLPITTTSVMTDPTDAMNNNGISYPSKSDEGFVVPDKFYVVLDLEEGTLAYIVDGQYLGVAFSDLKGKGILYPMVSSVWGHCEITMHYINGLEPEPLQLMDSCRRVIRKQLGRSNLHLTNKLTLPNSLRNYLVYQ
jgi:SPRY domain-containing SOCS box protein 1/4